ncbi:MAG TPA: recombinase family protein [Candidatus Binatia bacterium]|nr:recombinase family protein [Candidatus Binatia bacterium]
MTKAYSYLRTSSDDGDDKLGIPSQRNNCLSFAARAGYEIVREFVDDGWSGKLYTMDQRPDGAKLVQAIADNGVSAIIVNDGDRIGRSQPVFWQFIGLCRAKRISVVDVSGNDLSDSLQGGIRGMLAEMEHSKIIKRLADGKRQWRGQKRVEGRWPYGEHPSHDYDAERIVVERIRQMSADGATAYRIAKTLNGEGTRTRYGKEFKTQTVQNILERGISNESGR